MSIARLGPNERSHHKLAGKTAVRLRVCIQDQPSGSVTGVRSTLTAPVSVGWTHAYFLSVVDDAARLPAAFGNEHDVPLPRRHHPLKITGPRGNDQFAVEFAPTQHHDRESTRLVIVVVSLVLVQRENAVRAPIHPNLICSIAHLISSVYCMTGDIHPLRK